MQKKIILASKSLRRKELLKQMGFKFKVDVSEVDERKFFHSSPVGLVKSLSKAKAEAVSKRYKNAIIISADTLVVLDKEVIGKPKSAKNAKEILRKLSGKTHTVITGFTVLDSKTKKEISKTVATKVKFKKLTEKEISDYIKTGEPMDKAGAYGIQDKAGVFVESISGDYFNIVGLPISAISSVLKDFGIDTV